MWLFDGVLETIDVMRQVRGLDGSPNIGDTYNLIKGYSTGAHSRHALVKTYSECFVAAEVRANED